MAKPKTETKPTPEAAQTDPNAPSTYTIEPSAPPYVAGIKVGDRTEIDLTEPQARAELLAGHIWPKGMERAAPAVPQPEQPTETQTV